MRWATSLRLLVGGNAAMNAPIDAVPRNYNFAADILKRNLDAGRGEKAAYIDHRGISSPGRAHELPMNG